MLCIHYKNCYYYGQINSETQKHGSGIIIFVFAINILNILKDEGMSIIGQWQNDLLYGNAIINIPNQGCGLATFDNNQLHGILKMLDYEGFYIQEFCKGKKNGNGIYYDGNIYELITYSNDYLKSKLMIKKNNPIIQTLHKKLPNFLDDKQNLDKFQQCQINDQFYFGFGKKSYPNGMGIVNNQIEQLIKGQNNITKNSIWQGMFKKGSQENLGQIFFDNDDIYYGELKNGFMEGKGIYWMNKSKKWYFGIFVQGKCKEFKQNGQCQLSDFKQKMKDFGFKIHKVQINFKQIEIEQPDIQLSDNKNFQEKIEQKENFDQNIQNKQSDKNFIKVLDTNPQKSESRQIDQDSSDNSQLLHQQDQYIKLKEEIPDLKINELQSHKSSRFNSFHKISPINKDDDLDVKLKNYENPISQSNIFIQDQTLRYSDKNTHKKQRSSEYFHLENSKRQKNLSLNVSTTRNCQVKNNQGSIKIIQQFLILQPKYQVQKKMIISPQRFFSPAIKLPVSPKQSRLIATQTYKREYGVRRQYY